MLAGDLQYCKWVNENVGQGKGEFFPKTGSSLPLDQGGIMINDDAAGISTNGIPVYQMTRKRWSIEVEVLNECTDGLTHELIQKLNLTAKDTRFTFATPTHVFVAEGKVVGENVPDLQTGLIKLKFSGGRILSKI